jgi:serine/threonine-protein kinase Chk2
LFPLHELWKPLYLVDEISTIGRSNANTFPICHEEAGIKLGAISKVQFAIRKSGDGTVLVDKSTNGTFVNGLKVGFDKSKLLQHNDLISLINPSQSQFIFLKTGSSFYHEDYPEELKEKCIISRELGAGAFGVVKLGILKEHQSSKPVAIKIINKIKFPCEVETQKESNKILNEVTILKSLTHPNIIKLWDVVEVSSHLYIILEYANGGELFDNVVQESKLPEERAKLYFYQIVKAVQHMHQNRVVHRDMKLENVLLCYRNNEDIPSLVKVTDFGLSKMINNETFLKTICGTKLYIAPEIIRSTMEDYNGQIEYDAKVDMWSLGVILYILLSGSPPFDKHFAGKTIELQICDGDFSFPKLLRTEISFEAIDLVKHLMVVNSQKRFDCEQTLKHDWLIDPGMLDKAHLVSEIERKLIRGSELN